MVMQVHSEDMNLAILSDPHTPFQISLSAEDDDLKPGAGRSGEQRCPTTDIHVRRRSGNTWYFYPPFRIRSRSVTQEFVERLIAKHGPEGFVKMARDTRLNPFQVCPLVSCHGQRRRQRNWSVTVTCQNANSRYTSLSKTIYCLITFYSILKISAFRDGSSHRRRSGGRWKNTTSTWPKCRVGELPTPPPPALQTRAFPARRGTSFQRCRDSCAQPHVQ